MNRHPRHLLRGLTLLFSGWLAATAGAAESRIARHGDWMVGCDNLGRCAALGMSSAIDATGAGVAIRIAGDALAPGGWSMALIPIGASPSGLTIGPSADALVPADARRDLDAAQTARWLDALRSGVPITLHGPDAARWSAPSAEGFTQAWRELSRARLTMPPGTRGPERRRLAPAVEVFSSSRLPVQMLHVACPDGGRDLRRFAWANQATLWSVTCAGPRQLWLLEPAPYQSLVPLQLPDAGAASIAAGTAGLTNSAFEFDFGILRASEHPPGREDCGIQRAWAFDGREWYLLERREMPRCVGLEPSDWIATYSRR